MIEIDGAMGEGGGQVLRSALGLSLATGQPFRIRDIRAGRAKPGILRQHLAAVDAAVQVGGASASGAALGSRELAFTPGKARGGNYRFAVGTAGSTTLVLQAVLPALLTADEPSTIVLEGGTHNPLAPPFDFLERALLPLVERMGPRVRVALERPGFYPAGGGRFVAEIEPAKALVPLELGERGEIHERRARARVANLAPHIARRELQTLADMLDWPPETLRAEPVTDAIGPGNVLVVDVVSEHVTEVFTGFGRRGATAENVAAEVAGEVREYLASGAPVGPHLADQLLVPLALAGGGRFRTVRPTRHTTTNAEVLRAFLDVRVTIEKETRDRWVIGIGEGAGR